MKIKLISDSLYHKWDFLYKNKTQDTVIDKAFLM